MIRIIKKEKKKLQIFKTPLCRLSLLILLVLKQSSLSTKILLCVSMFTFIFCVIIVKQSKWM